MSQARLIRKKLDRLREKRKRLDRRIYLLTRTLLRKLYSESRSRSLGRAKRADLPSNGSHPT